MSGRYAPGTKITIRGLAEALGISPTPVREAVGRLAAEGAIEAQPNAWMRVPLLPAATLEELREIRVSLEGMATARAVSAMTAEERTGLHAAEARIVHLRPTGRPAEMIPAIRAFHFTLYRAARAPVLLQLIEGLWLRTGPAVNLLFPDYTSRERGRLRARVLRAVDRGDADAARAAMEQDIGRALDHLIRLARAREADGAKRT